MNNPTHQLRVIGYGRVSTNKQVQNGASLETQEQMYYDHCRRNDYISLGYFSEEGESGRLISRTKLQEILRFIKLNKVDKLVMYKVDRFSRDTFNYYLCKTEIKKYGCQLEYISDVFDDRTSVGKLIEGTLAVTAAFYSDQLSERTKLNMVTKNKQGYHLSTPPAGYKRIEKLLVPDMRYFEYIKKAWHLLIYEGWISKDIAAFLSKNEVRNCRRSLINSKRLSELFHNPVYYGKIKAGDTYVSGLHTPMITEEEYNLAQKLLNKHNRNKMKNYLVYNPNFILNRTLRCITCGEVMTGSFPKKKYGYYRCYNSSCNQKQNLKKTEAESFILSYYDSQSLDEPTVTKVIHILEEQLALKNLDTKKETVDKEEQIRQLKQTQSKLLDLMLDGSFPEEELKKKNMDLKMRIEKLESDLHNLTSTRQEVYSIARNSVEFLTHLGETYRNLSIQNKHSVNSIFFPEGIKIKKKVTTTGKIAKSCN